jgi:hypothetical protein
MWTFRDDTQNRKFYVPSDLLRVGAPSEDMEITQLTSSTHGIDRGVSVCCLHIRRFSPRSVFVCVFFARTSEGPFLPRPRVGPA